jgi:hypothetical protein
VSAALHHQRTVATPTLGIVYMRTCGWKFAAVVYTEVKMMTSCSLHISSTLLRTSHHISSTLLRTFVYDV